MHNEIFINIVTAGVNVVPRYSKLIVPDYYYSDFDIFFTIGFKVNLRSHTITCIIQQQHKFDKCQNV